MDQTACIRRRRAENALLTTFFVVVINLCLFAACSNDRGADSARPPGDLEGRRSFGRAPRTDAPAERDAVSLQACAIDLCGPPAERLRFQGKDPAPPSDAATDQLAPLIDELFAAQADALVARDQALTSILRSNVETARLPTELKAALAVGGWLNLLGHRSDEFVFVDADGRHRFEPEKLRALAPSLDSSQARKTAHFLDVFAQDRHAELGRLARGANLEAFLNQISGDEEVSPEFVSRRLRTYLLLARAISEKMGPSPFEDVDLKSLEEAAETGAPSGHVARAAVNALGRILMLKALDSPAVLQAADEVEASLPRMATNLKWPDRSKAIRDHLGSRRSQTRAEAIGSCRAEIARALRASPTDEQIHSAMQNLVPRVQAAALAVAPDFFVGSDLRTATLAIEAVRFVPPLSRNEMANLAERTLRRRIEGAQRMKAEATLAAKRDGNWLAYVAWALTRQESDSKGRFMADMESDCSELLSNLPTDRIYGKGEAHFSEMSWHSVRFPDHAVGILAHEIGHAILKRLRETQIQSSESFAQAVTCARDRNVALGNNPSPALLREDWCDTFGAAVARSLRASARTAENMACLLFEPTANADAEADLTLQASRADVHSPKLVRALQFHLALGREVPRSCVRALPPRQREAVARSCVPPGRLGETQ